MLWRTRWQVRLCPRARHLTGRPHLYVEERWQQEEHPTVKTKCHVTQGADQKLSAVASPNREKAGREQQYKKTSGHLTIDCNYFQLVYLWRRAYFAPCSPIGLENYLKISTQFAFMSQPLKKYWSSLTFCPKYSHLNEILKTLLLNFICQRTSSILKLWENQKINISCQTMQIDCFSNAAKKPLHVSKDI